MIYSEDRHGQVSFVYWVLQKEQPMKSLLSANLSLLQLVGSTVGWSVFSRSCWFFFRLFWMKLHYFNMYELTALFLWKFYFCTYLAKNSPKIGNSVLFFWFFLLKTSSFDSLENNLKGEILWCLTYHCNVHIGQNSRLWDIFKYGLWTGQVVGFLEVQYLKKEMRSEVDFFLYVSSKLIGFGLVSWKCPNYFKIINQQYIQRTDMAQFSSFIRLPQTKSPMKSLLSICTSLLRLFSSAFFLGVIDLFFSGLF